MSELTVEKVLRKADKRLSHPNTWCKGSALSGSRCCVNGAICYAVSGDYYDGGSMEQKAMVVLKDVLKNDLNSSLGAISYNDAAATSFKDIKLLLKKGIKLARKRRV